MAHRPAEATPESPAVDGRWPALVGSVLLLTLTIERVPVPLPVRAAAIPATTLVAVAAVVPLSLGQKRVTVTPLLRSVLLLVGFLVVHSVVMLFVDLSVFGAGRARTIAWIRQLIALAAGVAVYLTARFAFQSLPDRSVVVTTVAGALPALVLSGLTALALFAGVEAAGDVAGTVRSAFGLRPLGQNRASGLSLEPSHFGYTLVVGVVPMAYAGVRSEVAGRLTRVGLVGAVAAFVAAASVTSAGVLAGGVAALTVFGPNRRAAVATIGGLAVGVVALVTLAPTSYPAIQIQALVTGDWNLSITTRVWSTLGPLLAYLEDPHAVVGYGLGGTTTHFETLVPPSAARDIRAVTYESIPNLNSMLGRLLAEGGVVGTTLFVLAFRDALREALHVRERVAGVVTMAPFALGALLAGAVVSFGSFALPFLWLWFGLVDARYVGLDGGTREVD